MSKSKHEIPPAMLDVAAKAYLDNLLPEKFKADFDGENHTHHFTAYAQEMARLMLEAAGVPEMVARIAALEADSRRLRGLMEHSGIDGFSGVADDRYDFAIQVATERDHDEPTDQDEFDGWRQLIDAAMNAPKGAGGK